jgi:hypothetical protein
MMIGQYSRLFHKGGFFCAGVPPSHHARQHIKIFDRTISLPVFMKERFLSGRQ